MRILTRSIVVAIAAILVLSALAFVPAVFAQSSPVQVVNVTSHVVNDEDSGVCGYWALDHYNKQIAIYTTSTSGVYFVNETYEGFWQTFTGALSPNADCSTLTPLEGTTASGTFEGYAAFYVSGTLSPTMKTGGFIGTFNFGGSQSDVLNLVYSAQKGDTSYTDMLSFYFPGGYTFPSGYPSPFYFAYHYQGQTWIDASSGITGNIVT
jgi:hypothetical protein